MDATWSKNPATGEWNTATNWDPAEVPTNTAHFSSSTETAIFFAQGKTATVGKIEFSSKAPAYTFTFDSSASTPALTIEGEGIANHSPTPQSFIVASTGTSYEDPQLKFTDSATAGEEEMLYSVGPENLKSYGGGIIGFCDSSTAGSASFIVRTGAQRPPEEGSTVGGEVSFSDNSSADRARFTIYGSLGKDGDTFGNAVFHDTATADNASFTNVGGTVHGGDGGNTQFYDNATAAYGLFNNQGGTHNNANGGDVAFDGTSNGGRGYFYNHAALAKNAYGGVTSFNNNYPAVGAGQGASAGQGCYHNYGARGHQHGGGGHTEFSAKYGSPTAANGCFVNYGSEIEDSSSAGHTIFSISLPTEYNPTAGNAIFWNHPGVGERGAAGYTEFSVYGSGSTGSNVPTAGDGTFHNLGGYSRRASGGYTKFSDTASAGNSRLIASGGTDGGYGGRILFSDDSEGGTANVQLFGNGELDISGHNDGMTLRALDMTGGAIVTRLGKRVTSLTLSEELILNSTRARFSFCKSDGFELDTRYTILTAPNLPELTSDRFDGNSLDGVEPTFTLVGNDLQVSFNRD